MSTPAYGCRPSQLIARLAFGEVGQAGEGLGFSHGVNRN